MDHHQGDDDPGDCAATPAGAVGAAATPPCRATDHRAGGPARLQDVRAYLTDRLLHRQWPQAAIAAELGTHLVRVRDLIGQTGVRREGPTARQRAVAQRARQFQAVAWQGRRAARLAELGFPDLAAYLDGVNLGARPQRRVERIGTHRASRQARQLTVRSAQPAGRGAAQDAKPPSAARLRWSVTFQRVPARVSRRPDRPAAASRVTPPER